MGTCGSKPCKEEVEEKNNEMKALNEKIAAINEKIAPIYAKIYEKNLNNDYDTETLYKQIDELQREQLRLIQVIQEKINKNSGLEDSRLYREDSDSKLEKQLDELMNAGFEKRKGGKKSRRKQTRGKKSRRKQTRGKKSRRKQKGGYTPLEEDFRKFVLDTQTPETKIELIEIDEIYPPDSGKLDELLKTDITKIQAKLAALYRAYLKENTKLKNEENDLEKQNIKKKIGFINKLILINSYITKFHVSTNKDI
jgi:hypothetical protein